MEFRDKDFLPAGADPSHDHEHAHDGGHGHVHGPHTHTHPEEETHAIVNRLSRSIGHLERVRQMVADGYDCSDVLIQLSAVRSALNSAGLAILKSHMNHCIIDAVKNGDMQAVADLNKAVERYFK
ncbi:MAG: metal-sensing transcriptional repressor [Oscillospiraceae bacterium]|nr:metal-sensing transcriptional repressor [Oscillospiraceae bacterium]